MAGALAGLTLFAGSAPASAWELGYQPPERGLREIYTNGEHKIVSRSDKRIDTWCVYDRRGTLLRRTLTLDSFFVIERTRYRPERREPRGADRDGPRSYRADVNLPDGSIWPLMPGKTIRFAITVAGPPGKTLRIEGQMSVVDRREVTVGGVRLPAIIVRTEARHWYEAYPIGDSSAEYAYFPGYRNAILLKDIRYDPERRVPWPEVVRLEDRSNASLRRLIQRDCGPPTT